MRGGGRVHGLVVYRTDWFVLALLAWFVTVRLGLHDRVRRWDERVTVVRLGLGDRVRRWSECITENVVVSRSDCGVVLSVIHCGCITDRRDCRCVYYLFITRGSGGITVVVAESWTH